MTRLQIQRLNDALEGLDVGVSAALLRTDPQAAINQVLRQIGAAMIHDLEDASVDRAIRAMEAA